MKYLRWPILTLAAFFLCSPVFAARPSIRVLTFQGNDPWNAVQTLLLPEGEHHYRTEELGALIRHSNKNCEDLLSNYQKRPLEVMRDNKYITQELFNELSDPRRRVQDMRQYVLVTLFEIMDRKDALAKGFTEMQFLDEPEIPGKVRVHLGSMYAVRGYDLERVGHDQFRSMPFKLPFENEGLPAPLERVLKRDHLPLTVEIGRALVEKGADRKTFPLMMKILTGVLAADASVFKVPADAVAIFGRADDATHARLYSSTLGGKPMTPQMQEELEAGPAAALNDFAGRPEPTREYWAGYGEGVIVGSLKQLLEKFPEGELSASVARLRAKFPNASASQALALLRDLQFFSRQDFDLTWHDPHRPGQRAPLRWQDWGTGFLEVRMMRLFKKHGFDALPKSIEGLLSDLKLDSVKVDPDFGQTGWLERNIHIGVPQGWTPQSGERLPSVTVENLDATVKNKSEYLARVILAFAAKIEYELEHLSAFEHRLVAENMNEFRQKKGLPPLERATLRTFLETYDLNFASSDPALQAELKILGADLRQGIRLDNPFKGGHVDLKIDPTKLGLDLSELMKNPQKMQAALQEAVMKSLTAVFKPCTVYRFGWSEISEMRTEYPQFAAGGVLAPSFHRQRMQRMYGAYQ